MTADVGGGGGDGGGDQHTSGSSKQTASRTPYFVLGALIGIASAVIYIQVNGKIGPQAVLAKDAKESRQPKKPHLIFVLTDDLGWSDVGWNNPDMKTPNLKKLVSEGILLNQSYSQPLCTPSRAAFMTGYYPFRNGMQHQILWSVQPYGLPLNVELLPAKLRKLGYRTHLVGKWHLGMCKWEYTPTYRGFDSFYGYYSLLLTHFTKQHTAIQDRSITGYDFRDNTGVVPKTDEFISEMFLKRAEKLIDEHYGDQPMFLYFSLDLPKWPSEAPQKYLDMYAHIENPDRRGLSAMVSAMDDIVGNLTRKLKEKEMWEDTLFVFFSDNGGFPYLAASNWPFRGGGGTLFEGGTRVPGFVSGSSSLLKNIGTVSNELIHITDFHTTFLKLAGGTPEDDLDGLDVWDTLSKGKPSPRKEMVYNIDDVMPGPGAAIRVGDYKLIVGNPEIFYPRRSLEYTDGWHPPAKTNATKFTRTPVHFGELGDVPPPANVTMLFNLKDDPEERNNLAKDYPMKVEELRLRLKEYEKGLMPSINPPPDLKRSNPANFGGVWSPGWC